MDRGNAVSAAVHRTQAVEALLQLHSTPSDEVRGWTHLMLPCVAVGLGLLKGGACRDRSRGRLAKRGHVASKSKGGGYRPFFCSNVRAQPTTSLCIFCAVTIAWFHWLERMLTVLSVGADDPVQGGRLAVRLFCLGARQQRPAALAAGVRALQAHRPDVQVRHRRAEARKVGRTGWVASCLRHTDTLPGSRPCT